MSPKWYGLFMTLGMILVIVAIAAYVGGMKPIGVIALLGVAVIALVMPRSQ